MFFFFFFEQLYYIDEIKQAFKNVCLDKFLSDGYFDLSAYVYGRITNEQMYAILKAENSKYLVLYKKPFPKPEIASEVWKGTFGEPINQSTRSLIELTYNESRGIVNWVYRTLKKSQERESFTKELFEHIKELHGIENDITFVEGVAYNAKKVDLRIFSSVSNIYEYISSLKAHHKSLFFRGHSDSNYLLRPSVMRMPSIEINESEIYHQMLINCPNDFEKCHSHLEKLVKMQHYGLPTRLIDITRNMLVALFFACESHPEAFGELLLISVDNDKIKYPQSDTVSILASLPVFSKEMQQKFNNFASDESISDLEFNKQIARLTYEVRLEKPAFVPDVRKEDILRNYIVFSLKNNNRIVKQDGAFILCGLSAEKDSLKEFRYYSKDKKVVILIRNKDKILEQLELFSINRAALFPEIESVAEYLKNKYSQPSSLQGLNL